MKLKKALLIYTTEFLIIVIVLLMVLGQYSVIASNDGYHQNYMVMVYMGKLIREFCSNLLHGSFVVPQFDFAIGLGEGIMLPTNFYGLGDPFLVLSALCPVAYSAYFYTCIYLLKIYCSGLAFMYYCRVRKAEYEMQSNLVESHS